MSSEHEVFVCVSDEHGTWTSGHVPVGRVDGPPSTVNSPRRRWTDGPGGGCGRGSCRPDVRPSQKRPRPGVDRPLGRGKTVYEERMYRRSRLYHFTDLGRQG